MTPEEAYAEALRRIHEAEEIGAVKLVLGELRALNRIPPELERLKLSFAVKSRSSALGDHFCS
jgi:hypothetical protein